MGSQGILKSTDAGATWTVLGEDVFGPGYDEPPGQFPQYDAVGKVRVDPNNSSKVVAGTKKGIFVSYNGGVDWTGPCTTNGFPTQRQDITGLELSDMGGGVTRIIAAVGVRGFATTVQYDLGMNGANGLYARERARQRLPDVHVDRVEREWVRLRERGLRQPVHDRREHECGQRRPLRQSNDGRPARQDRHRSRAERSGRHLCAGAVDRSRTAAAAAARPAASSGSGRPRTAGRPGRTWPARKVRRWAGAATTTRRTGTTRGSPSTRTTRTASTSTRTTSGSRPAPARRSPTSRAATAAGRASTSTSTRSSSSTAPRAC